MADSDAARSARCDMRARSTLRPIHKTCHRSGAGAQGERGYRSQDQSPPIDASGTHPLLPFRRCRCERAGSRLFGHCGSRIRQKRWPGRGCIVS